jgi:MFS transporter, DHA1 family, tetracycline resistance protein
MDQPTPAARRKTPPIQSQPPLLTRSIGVVLVTVFLASLSMGVVYPVLPKLALTLEGGDAARAAQALTIFAVIYAAGQFVVGPLLGSLSDRFGRRPVLLLSNIGLALDYLLMTLAPTMAWLVVGRAISGVVGRASFLAYAYIADCLPAEKRIQGFGWIGAAVSLGAVVGPLLGGALGEVHERLPFAVAATLSFINWASAIFLLRESLPAKADKLTLSWTHFNPFAAIASFVKDYKALRALLIAGFLLELCLAGVTVYLILYTSSRYNFSASQNGLLFAILGFGDAIAQVRTTQLAAQWVGLKLTAIIGIGLRTMALLIFAFADNAAILWCGVPLNVLGAVGGPALIAILSGQVASDEQGRLAGVRSAIAALAAMTGPPLMFGFFAIVSHQNGGALLGAPLLAAAGLSLVAILLMCRTPDFRLKSAHAPAE